MVLDTALREKTSQYEDLFFYKVSQQNRLFLNELYMLIRSAKNVQLMGLVILQSLVFAVRSGIFTSMAMTTEDGTHVSRRVRR